MYGNTLATNRRVGDSQRKAAAEVAMIPFMSQQHIRIDSPYGLLGQKQAGIMRTNANKVASSVADLDKSLGVRLEGENKANVIIDKANLMDVQRIDKLKAMQNDANYKFNAINTEIFGKNRQTLAKAAQSIHLINANQDLANNTALQNLIRANDKNRLARKYNYLEGKFNALAEDPKIKTAVADYKNILSNSGQAKYKTE